MSTDIVNAKTGLGAVIGGVIGFICAGPVGAGLGALVGGGVAHASDNPGKGEMTPRRRLIFERAMAQVQDAGELNKLADAFSGEGLSAEADMLRKRANLRSLPPDVTEKRRVLFRKAMSSDDPSVIEQTANAFMGEGAAGSARVLLDHADAVRAAHQAGKATKPMSGGSIEEFANKLAKAIIHFGPGTIEAQRAAANLARARGKEPTPELIAEIIKVAAGALDVQVVTRAAPAHRAPAPAAATPVPDSDGDVPPAEDVPAAETSGEPTGAPEPTVVGPPAQVVEPPAAVQGARADVGIVANEGNGMANEAAAGATA